MVYGNQAIYGFDKQGNQRKIGYGIIEVDLILSASF